MSIITKCDVCGKTEDGNPLEWWVVANGPEHGWRHACSKECFRAYNKLAPRGERVSDKFDCASVDGTCGLRACRAFDQTLVSIYYNAVKEESVLLSDDDTRGLAQFLMRQVGVAPHVDREKLIDDMFGAMRDWSRSVNHGPDWLAAMRDAIHEVVEQHIPATSEPEAAQLRPRQGPRRRC